MRDSTKVYRAVPNRLPPKHGHPANDSDHHYTQEITRSAAKNRVSARLLPRCTDRRPTRFASVLPSLPVRLHTSAVNP